MAELTSDTLPAAHTPAEAAAQVNEAPAEGSLAWYDALIAQHQQQVEALYAEFNMARGRVEVLTALRAIEAKRTRDGST